MASPSFFSEGHTPVRTDTRWKILMKILGATIDAGSGGGGGGLAGAGSPEGVTVAPAGTTYLNTADNSFWAKGSGIGDTGWIPLIT